MASPVRMKWWQQEIIESGSSPEKNEQKSLPTNEEKPLADDSKKVIDTLLQLEGPKVGVQYKIEVTGPLNITDGTFWICPVSSGFIQEKLEPLSRLLRSSILADPNLKNVEISSKVLVCVQSCEQSSLCMRGMLMNKVDDQSVKIRLVDVGRVEVHPNDKLYKLPEQFATIPYMAFSCKLFEESRKMSHEDKWRFNDLVKKKILNFTCEQIVSDDGVKRELFGVIETIIDKPIMNINEEMKRPAVKKSKEPKEPKVKMPATASVPKAKTTPAKNSTPGIPIGVKFSTFEKKLEKLSTKPNNNSDKGSGWSSTCNSSDDIIRVLTRIAGPIIGLKYKIEVTSTLDVTGTFWACPLTSGFIRDKIEPIHDLLRIEIMANSQLRKVDDGYAGLISVLSKEHRLLMRGYIVKQINTKMVKILLIDIGRHEEHEKAKLCRVPESIAVIPPMAFHCTLFEEVAKLSYQEKWRFADICKRKIVEFCCLKFIEREQKKIVFGKLVTDVGQGQVDVIEELRRAKESDDDD